MTKKKAVSPDVHDAQIGREMMAIVGAYAGDNGKQEGPVETLGRLLVERARFRSDAQQFFKDLAIEQRRIQRMAQSMDNAFRILRASNDAEDALYAPLPSYPRFDVKSCWTTSHTLVDPANVNPNTATLSKV